MFYRQGGALLLSSANQSVLEDTAPMNDVAANGFTYTNSYLLALGARTISTVRLTVDYNWQAQHSNLFVEITLILPLLLV